MLNTWIPSASGSRSWLKRRHRLRGCSLAGRRAAGPQRGLARTDGRTDRLHPSRAPLRPWSRCCGATWRHAVLGAGRVRPGRAPARTLPGGSRPAVPQSSGPTVRCRAAALPLHSHFSAQRLLAGLQSVRTLVTLVTARYRYWDEHLVTCFNSFPRDFPRAVLYWCWAQLSMAGFTVWNRKQLLKTRRWMWGKKNCSDDSELSCCWLENPETLRNETVEWDCKKFEKYIPYCHSVLIRRYE